VQLQILDELVDARGCIGSVFDPVCNRRLLVVMQKLSDASHQPPVLLDVDILTVQEDPLNNFVLCVNVEPVIG